MPVISTVAAAVIDPAVAVKVLVVRPVGTVTEGCTGSNVELLLVSGITAPGAAAGPDNVTVQVGVWLEARLVGLQVRLVKLGGGGTIIMGNGKQMPL